MKTPDQVDSVTMMKKYNSIIIFVSILLSVAFARDPYSSHGSYNPYNPHGLRNPYRPHDSFGFQNQQSAQQISPGILNMNKLLLSIVILIKKYKLYLVN